eukprot:2688685-Pleurochrysis_carterae.AAC.1
MSEKRASQKCGAGAHRGRQRERLPLRLQRRRRNASTAQTRWRDGGGCGRFPNEALSQTTRRPVGVQMADLLCAGAGGYQVEVRATVEVQQPKWEGNRGLVRCQQEDLLVLRAQLTGDVQ